MGGAGVVLSTTLAYGAQVADALDCRGELGVEERDVGDLIGVMLRVAEEPVPGPATHGRGPCGLAGRILEGSPRLRAGLRARASNFAKTDSQTKV
jgi:hypothetical protein